jgi:DNA-binding SARP family transcriptional activator
MPMLQGFASWVGRLARLVVLAGILAGVPYGLVTQVGWPLPRSLPTSVEQVEQLLTTPVTDQMVINVLAVALWILWGSFTASAAAEVIAAVRGITVPRIGALAPMQNLAAWLLSGLTAGVLATAGLSPAAGISPTDPAPVVQADRTPPATAAGPAAAMSSGTPAAGGPDHTLRLARATGGTTDEQLIHEVARGDWMWHIAGRYLGDETRYPEIAALNPDLQRPGFPDHIEPGDQLALPEDARDRGERRHATGDTIAVSSTRSDSRSDTEEPPAPVTPPPATPEPEQPAPAPSTPGEPDPSPAAEPPAPSPAPTATPQAPAETPSANSTPATGEESDEDPGAPAASDEPDGVVLPSGAWISVALAALIAVVATMTRLHQRRHHRLRTLPIPTDTAAAPSPVPESLADAETAGTRLLDFDNEPATLPGLLPDLPAERAPVAVTEDGAQVSLFDLPGPIVALDGDGAPAVVRAVLASVLTTGASEHTGVQPRVVIPEDLLATLLPDGTAPTGLDPDGQAFDGERLIITADAAAAVTRLEEEMVHRRRLLDHADADSVTDLCDRDEQPEPLPPFLLIVPATSRHLPRVKSVATHRHELDLHTVMLGSADAATAYKVDTDGLLNYEGRAGTTGNAAAPSRLSTLTGPDLADVLQILRQAIARAEVGAEIDDPLPEPAETRTTAVIPTPRGEQPPVRLRVLGPVVLETDTGPVAEGIRTGSLAVLALLAAHPEGRSMDEIVYTLNPGTHDRPAARNRVRTDISAARTALRAATGLGDDARFITYHDRTRRYAIEVDLVDVDLWRMLTAIETANHADGDHEALAALWQATSYWTGEFATDLEQVWTIGYATTTRQQVVAAYARIAEITEADHPDEAANALEHAIEIDPVNEELYQRLMRIHGRQRHPDAVRATLRHLTDRLAEIGDSEPSQATQRVAARQLAGQRNGRVQLSHEQAATPPTADLTVGAEQH